MSRILVISPTPTHPVTAGNRSRIYQMLHVLMQHPVSVFFVFIGMEEGDCEAMKKFFNGNFLYIKYQPPLPRKLSFFERLERKLRHLTNKPKDYKMNIDDWYPADLDPVVVNLFASQKFDAMLVEYVYLSKAFVSAPKNILKILDTHDVMTDRDLKFKEAGLQPSWFYTTGKQEQKGINRADLVIAINGKEADFFKKLTRKTVLVSGHAPEPVSPDEPRDSRSRLLFLASMNENNRHALNYFLSEIFPLVLKVKPDVTLVLAGSISKTVGDETNIIKAGYVPQVNLLYRETDIVINPICFGTGLKIKNIEALSFSKPLITTSVGAEGLETGINKAFLVKDNAADFASAVLELLTNDNKYSQLQTEAYDFALQYKKKSTDELQNIIRFIPS